MPAKRSPTQPADVFSPDSLGEGFSQPRRRPGGRAAAVDTDMAPLTAGSPVSRGLMLSSPRPPGNRAVADASFATPRQTPPSQQEGQGSEMGTPADMCFSVANTQPRRNILTTVQRAVLSSESATEETQDSSTPFSSSLIEASFIEMEAPSTSVRSSGAPSSSQVVDVTPLASQESAYSNMYVDRPHMSQARDLEVLLSQVPNQVSSSSTPFSPSRTLEEEMPGTPAGPSLPQPPRRPAPTNVLSQRDPNATPLHVQLARVAEPQTCSQGAKGHAELVRDYIDEFANEDDGDGESGSTEDGRALFASPVQAALDTLSALREPSAPAALRRHNNDVDEDAPLTQIVEASSNSSPPTPPVVGSKRSRSSSKRHPSPEPISSTQRHRDDGAEWSRLARQFFEFIDSRPELKTIEVPPPTAAAGVRRAH